MIRNNVKRNGNVSCDIHVPMSLLTMDSFASLFTKMPEKREFLPQGEGWEERPVKIMQCDPCMLLLKGFNLMEDRILQLTFGLQL